MAQLTQVKGRATAIYQSDGYTVVRYHATEVVKFNNREIILNSGGYYTLTTKTQMNQTANQFGLDFQVKQKDFQWRVLFNGKTLPFSNGMKLKRG